MREIYFYIKDFMGISNVMFIVKSKILLKYKKATDGLIYILKKAYIYSI